jgi:mono/diheme cytochrome c family protein
MRNIMFAAVILAAACTGTPAPPAPAAVVAATPVGDPVEGLRVATRVGCNGCHGENGAGQVFFENEEAGRIVAPNLTERRDLYDDAALVSLLREGRTHDGHLPLGMPIPMFQHLSDREVRDITAWLRGLPHVPNPLLPPTKWSDAVVKMVAEGTDPLLDDVKPTPGNRPPSAPPTEPLALGKHLAMTTCGECHGWDLNGFEGDSTPSLVVAKAYTPEQFARLMRTGEVAAGGKSASGLMSGVAAWRFNAMTDEEIAALKAYLDSR